MGTGAKRIDDPPLLSQTGLAGNWIGRGVAGTQTSYAYGMLVPQIPGLSTVPQRWL